MVFHLAGRPGVQDSWGEGFVDSSRRNIELTQRVYEASVDSQVERVVWLLARQFMDQEPQIQLRDQNHNYKPLWREQASWRTTRSRVQSSRASHHKPAVLHRLWTETTT